MIIPAALRLSLPIAAFGLLHPAAYAQPYAHISGTAQGTTYQLTYRPNPFPLPTTALDTIFNDINQSLSRYTEQSLTSTFNRSTTGVPLDIHLRTVIQAAQSVAYSSNGAFDITILPAMEAWGFGNTTIHSPPSRRRLHQIRKDIDYRLLALRNDSLVKTRPEVRIDPNGIAQGYTVDRIAERLSQAGITDFLIELGGEIRLQGNNPDGKPWTVGIERPTLTLPTNTQIGWAIQPDRAAVTSSGVYRTIRYLQNKPYPHIIDPRRAKPVRNDILSVTVIAPDALTADAVDNTCLVLGPRRALHWVSTLPDVDIFMVCRRRKGRLREYRTNGFPKPHIYGTPAQKRSTP